IWALFGDSIGGVLNPILTLINIGVFVYLTKAVQDVTERNNKQGLETSRKIALMSLKHEEFTYFKQTLDLPLLEWGKDSKDSEKFSRLFTDYSRLFVRLEYLFPELDRSETAREIFDIMRYIR